MRISTNYLNKGKYRRGVHFALAAALISGFSIYINKFAVMQVKDPFIFTTAKNIAVAALLLALLIFAGALPELKRLALRQWLTLGAIGCVGGSIPFLLFFYGLSLANAASAALIHKTLFIWVALLALLFLGERVGKLHLAALAALVGGSILLLGWPKSWPIGRGELFILAATLLWALEAVVARRVMKQISPKVVAFGRMFFGAVVMLVYLAMTGRAGVTAVTGMPQLLWIALTGVLLFGYVTCYYSGLKHAPASVVASILVLGSVITSLLYAVFDARTYSFEQVVGMLLIVATALLLGYITPLLRVKKSAIPVVLAEK